MDNAADSYQRFLNGDDDGIYEIIDEFNKSMSLYINHIVNNICIAEEIVQNTFVTLAIKQPKFNGKSTFKTWLFSIARNQALDFIRRSKRHPDTQIDKCFCLSDETDIENEFLKEEQKIELHNAIKKLNSDYSQVIYLMFFEQFSIEETAKIMHKTKRQTSDLIYRAKKSLKNELERTGFIYEKL